MIRHYDAVGRAKASLQAFGPVPGGGQLTGDISTSIVLEESGITYDAAGNQIAIVSKQRFDNATGTGALGSPTTETAPKARVSYSASYPDALAAC